MIKLNHGNGAATSASSPLGENSHRLGNRLLPLDGRQAKREGGQRLRGHQLQRPNPAGPRSRVRGDNRCSGAGRLPRGPRTGEGVSLPQLLEHRTPGSRHTPGEHPARQLPVSAQCPRGSLPQWPSVRRGKHAGVPGDAALPGMRPGTGQGAVPGKAGRRGQDRWPTHGRKDPLPPGTPLRRGEHEVRERQESLPYLPEREFPQIAAASPGPPEGTKTTDRVSPEQVRSAARGDERGR